MKSIISAGNAFTLDIDSGKLFRDKEEHVPLSARQWNLLCLFVDNPGKLFSQDDLLGAIWKSAAVTPEAVGQAIRGLRSALGDDPKSPFMIETEYGRGYRFVAEVNETQPSEYRAITDSLDDERRAVRELVDELLRCSPDPHDVYYIAPMLLKARRLGRNRNLPSAYFRALDVLVGDIDKMRTSVTYPAPAHLSVNDLETVISTLENWLDAQNN